MEDGQRRGWLDVRWQWVAEERCSDWKCASTDGCDLLSQKVSCLLPTRPLCSFRHYWPWHLDHPSLILVWYPWLCSQLVQVISVISLLPCKMWNRPVLLVSPKAMFLVQRSLSCTPLLSVPSFPLDLSVFLGRFLTDWGAELNQSGKCILFSVHLFALGEWAIGCDSVALKSRMNEFSWK